MGKITYQGQLEVRFKTYETKDLKNASNIQHNMKSVEQKILHVFRNGKVAHKLDQKISHINIKNIRYLKDYTWTTILIPIRNVLRPR